jgi:GTP-binding protein
MEITKATFLFSNTDIEKLPAPEKPEYAFIGRSNVGKSSLINMLVKSRKLSKISSSPGKTRTINHFFINDSFYFVDLPGYGFAKVSKNERSRWRQMIDDYILKRSNLVCLFVLIDSRIPPQKNDVDFIRNLGIQGVPFTILFTKTDKTKVSKLKTNKELFENTLKEEWETLPDMFETSAKSSAGREEILAFITKCNNEFIKPV